MKKIQAKNKLAGFTIMEILIVLAIIAIVASISLPVYQQIAPKLNLNAAVRDITSDLRYAQQLSVAEQVIYKVAFDTANNRYSIINSDTGATLKTINLNGITISSISGLTGNEARFTATGAAIETGNIILLNNRNASSTIEIKPSGYVQISQ